MLDARRMLRVLVIAVALGGPGCDGGGADPDSSVADSGSASGTDAGSVADSGSVTDAASVADSGSVTDAGSASVTDAGSGSVTDAGPVTDAGSATDAGSDGGTAPRASCGADGDCTVGASCIAGLCFESETVSDATPAIGSIARMVVGADADGTLRLLTVDAADRTYDVVGRPGAFTVTPGGVASDLLPLEETGRAGTAVAHSAFASADERWILADQLATVREDRPIYGFGVVHAPDGSRHVITTPLVPRRPSEPYDPYPLHLWTLLGGAWSSEELVRNAGIDRDLHVRHDASGEPEVLYTDAFWIKRWRLETAGWASSIVHTFAPMPTRSGRSLWIDDDHGHTHLVHVLHLATSDELTYVELDDAGVVREAAIDGTGVYALSGSLSFDDVGDLFFLSVGETTSPNRRPYSLHRIASDGTERRTLLGTLRTDWSQSAALAVAPDGTVTLFVYAPAQPMELRTLSPR